MEAEKPVPLTNALKPVSRWSILRACVVLILPFAVIFAAAWWLTPIEPYATLNLDDEFNWCQFSPDGTMLVTKDIGGTRRVWDVERGHERFSLPHGWKTVLFSPDSGLLAAHEQEDDLRLRNARTGEEVASLGPKKLGTTLRFSPDGRFLVFQDHKVYPNKGSITFWNIESRQEQGSLESYSFDRLTFAPYGNSFATFRHQGRNVEEVLLWKMEQTNVLVRRHRITARVVAFSPDLKRFAAADNLPDGNGQVVMWDMMTGEKLWSVTFNQHGTALMSLSFIANGKVLSANGGNLNGRWRTTLWDVTLTPKEISSFSELLAVSSSPDGEWLAIPLDSGAKLIRISSPELGADLIVNGDRVFGVWGLNVQKLRSPPSFSPDGKMILVTGLYRRGHEPFLEKWLPKKYNPFRPGADGVVVQIWDADSHREIVAFSNCSDAWFSPDGQVLATLRWNDRKAIDLWKVPFRGSLWRILGWAVTSWLIVVAVGWAGVKLRRKMFSRTNALLPRPESGNGKQPDPKESPLPHDPPPPPS